MPRSDRLAPDLADAPVPLGDAAALRRGSVSALGMPAIVLGASFVGFGSLVNASRLGLEVGLAATLGLYALPGQVALVELFAAGTPWLALVLAVWLSGARLMPMVITLMPAMEKTDWPAPLRYLAAHFIMMTSWTLCRRHFRGLAMPDRLPFLFGFSGTLLVVCTLATILGFSLAGHVPGPVSLGLVFLNPIYFVLLFVGERHSRHSSLALLFGAVLGPVLYPLTAEWTLLVAGLIGGTAAFLLGRTAPTDQEAIDA